MRIFASTNFLKAYRDGNLVMQHCAEHAIHDFVRSYRSDRRNFVRRYDRVAGIRQQVLEIDISGKDRLLAHFANKQLTLLVVGSKHIVPRYTKQQLARDLASRQDAPNHFWPEQPSGFFTKYPDTAVQPYGMELHPDWIYWLDEEQSNVLHAIKDDLVAMAALLLDSGGRTFFLVGGPGTGKSCILLNLLKYYAEEGFNVGLAMSDQLIDYVAKSTNANIHQYIADNYWLNSNHEILLVDDPDDVRTINRYAEMVQEGSVKLVVQAFDPLQLDKSMTDQVYQDLIKTHQIREFILSFSYRQKENVGQATKNAAEIIAASTPYLDENKIKNYHQERIRLTQLANELVFRNPHGYTQTYENATIKNVVDEINRLISRPNLLWNHWQNLLVIETYQGSLRAECYEQFHRLKPKVITLGQIKSIKGLEFQHVFLFLGRELYEQIEFGFEGSGQKTYDQRRLLRIPFSRAKDSLVTFVLSND